MWRQSETFIYHQGCAEAKLIPAELEESARAREKVRVKRGKEAMLKKRCLRRLQCVSVWIQQKVKSKMCPVHFIWTAVGFPLGWRIKTRPQNYL